MEMLAGDADAAERELHDAIDVATDMGASRYIALYRTQLARVLLEQGRNEDAAAELEQARDIYNGDPAWKAAEALLLARRGETEEAVALAREALASMADSDNITAHAEVLVDVAEVLRAHGDLVGAADSLAAAVVLHDEKGNVLAARRCRRASSGNRSRRTGAEAQVTVARGATDQALDHQAPGPGPCRPRVISAPRSPTLRVGVARIADEQEPLGRPPFGAALHTGRRDDRGRRSRRGCHATSLSARFRLSGTWRGWAGSRASGSSSGRRAACAHVVCACCRSRMTEAPATSSTSPKVAAAPIPASSRSKPPPIAAARQRRRGGGDPRGRRAARRRLAALRPLRQARGSRDRRVGRRVRRPPSRSSARRRLARAPRGRQAA